MKFKALIAAGLLAVAMPISASAATLIQGVINITGGVNVAGSDFSIGGNVDLISPGVVSPIPGPTGDFAAFVSGGDAVTLTDIDFTAPGTIWEVGGFTFTALSFGDITNAPNGFHAFGQVTGNGFDATNGVLQFTTQAGTGVVSFSTTTSTVPLPAGVLLMGTALAGFGVMRRRKKAA